MSSGPVGPHTTSLIWDPVACSSVATPCVEDAPGAGGRAGGATGEGAVGGGTVAGQVHWCGCWLQLLPTAGQGLLSELMAPGPDPGLGGDPEEARLRTFQPLRHLLPFPGTLLPLPAELTVAESAGPLKEPPRPP